MPRKLSRKGKKKKAGEKEVPLIAQRGRQIYIEGKHYPEELPIHVPRGKLWKNARNEAPGFAKKRYIAINKRERVIKMLDEEEGILKQAAEALRRGKIYDEVYGKILDTHKKKFEKRFNNILVKAEQEANEWWKNVPEGVKQGYTIKEAKEIYAFERGGEMIDTFNLYAKDHRLYTDFNDLFKTDPLIAKRAVKTARDCGFKSAKSVAKVFRECSDKKAGRIFRQAAEIGEDPYKFLGKENRAKDLKKDEKRLATRHGKRKAKQMVELLRERLRERGEIH